MENLELDNSVNARKLKENFEKLKGTHLRSLLSDESRNSKCVLSFENLVFDFTHQKIDVDSLEVLEKLAEERNVKQKFASMFNGEKINNTENRSVLHTALRRKATDNLTVDGQNVIGDVHEVLGRIKSYTDQVRNGEKLGFTGKKLRNFISIGIGGSYLGGEFVYQSLKYHDKYSERSKNLNLFFLANVCPIDFKRVVHELDPEETLIIIISKTFTTAETIMNARTCKEWLVEEYLKKHPSLSQDDIKKVLSQHMCAVSTNISGTSNFGIDPENVFGFWDWVGGRYSVWSAVGGVPLSLVFGYDTFQEFLDGGRSMDEHLISTNDIRSNIPIMLGLIGFYDTYVAEASTRAILPYCQALCKFPNHIQQLDMESNGKSVNLENKFTTHPCGPVVFGEPGTNGQHSFYQLIHQGRNVPCEFIGFARSQSEVKLKEEKHSNHEELMSNFFAQPDALAYGKFAEEITGVPENLINHKVFKGDKSSLSLLFNELNAYTCGQLLSLYEHRVATEGFLYNINSFDQWGVELGKVCASTIRSYFGKLAEGQNHESLEKDLKLNKVTSNLLKLYNNLKSK